MKNLFFTAAMIAGIQLLAAPLVQINGAITDKTPGWRFVPSKPNKAGMTYNQFEGYYPDKGGKLYSNRIKLNKARGESAYYRIKFTGYANERSYQGINFYDAKGTLLPDNYDVLYAGDKQNYDRVFYAMDKVDSIEIFFQSSKGCQVWDLNVEKTTWQEAADYCDRLYKTMPQVSFKAPEGAMKQLPRTVNALKTGKPWRIVMLGDSIMQDTFHSQFHSLVQREFPNAKISWIISIRGATGCWFYCYADSFKKYVLDEKPDLLIIGGSSNFQPCRDYNGGITGGPAIGVVARAAKEALGCEVLFMTSTLDVDNRMHDPANIKKPLPSQPWFADNDDLKKREYNAWQLKGIARELNMPVWDMITPAQQWLFASGKPYQWHSRDFVHSGERGKQVIARIALEYFKTGK